MDLSHCRQRVERLFGEERALMRVIMARYPLLKGTVYTAKVKCGNKNCKCARGELHTVWRITRSHEGKNRTRSLGRQKELFEKYGQLTGNYRRFREARARIVEIQIEMVKLMNRIETMRRSDYGLKFGK